MVVLSRDQAMQRLAAIELPLDLLESTLGRPVDLVTTESLSPFIGPRIQEEAEDVIFAA